MNRLPFLLPIMLLAISSYCHAATFRGLETGLTLTIEGLSGDGSTVFGTQNGSLLRWNLSEQPELIADLPPNALGHVQPYAISYDGSILVGEYLYDRFEKVIPPFNDIEPIDLFEAFFYSADTRSFQTLGFLDEGLVAHDSASARAVSADGSVIVGGSTSDSGSAGFRWTASGGLERLPDPTELSGKFVPFMTDVSGDGNTAIGRADSTLDSPPPYSPMARWTSNEGTSLMTNPDGSYFHVLPSPNRLSADGSTAIGERNRLAHNRPQAWRWTESTGAVFLEDVVGNMQTDGSRTIDVSADGSFIVGDLFRDNRTGPMIWDQIGGVRFLEDYFRDELELDIGSWSLSKVIAVSDNGKTFVGRGINPAGQYDYWIVTTPTQLGDYDENGIVDATDYIVWRKTLGQVGTSLAADGNANNQIDSGDYDVWRAHFGQTVGSGSGARANAAVPEPSSLALLIVGMATAFKFRRTAVS